MTREAWEQGYQLAKIVQWKGEDMPWQELASNAARRAGTTRAIFALVAKQALQIEQQREEVIVYRTLSGKIIADPSDSFGEGYYPENQPSTRNIPVFRYTAWFFTKSRQPTGILASPETRESPCGNGARSGVFVRAVTINTPAQTAHIRSGDVIMEVNGRPSVYHELFSLFTPGLNTVGLCRNGQAMTTQLRLPVPQRTAAQARK